MSGGVPANDEPMAARWQVGVAGYDMRELPFGEIADRLSRFGVTRFELPYDPANAELPKAAEIFAGRDIEILSVGPVAPQYRLNATDNVRDVRHVIVGALKYAHRIGARYLNIGPGPNAQRDPFSTIQLLRRFLEPCLEEAETSGVTIVVENHFDMRSEDPKHQDVVRRAQSLAMLFDAVGSQRFQYVYDPANFYIAGEEAWPQAYRILKPYIAYLHLKDAVRYTELLHGEAAAHRVLADSLNGPFITVPVGQGGVNYEGLFGDLVAENYAGVLMLEAFSPPHQLEAMLTESLRYVRSKGTRALAAAR